MAGRPQKKNLDLFRHENDMRNDTRIKALEARYPEQYGYAIYCKMLEVLCEKEGLQYPFDELSIELLAGDFHTTSEKLKECIEYCVKLDLFQIHCNYIRCRQLELKHEDILTKRGISDEKIGINSPEMPISDEKIELSSRVKGSKGKLSKDKGSNNPIVPSWRESFEEYQKQENSAYFALISNKAWIEEQQKYNPNLNIPLSLEKAHNQFWKKEAGWKHKKKAKSQELDWERTYVNALSQRINQVWKTKENDTDNSGPHLSGKPENV